MRKGELLWKEPTESIVVDILHNPAYAGAFVYGRRPTDPLLRKPGHRGSGVVRKPMEEWVTIQQGVYPAYITWEEYTANVARLQANRARADTLGVVREGPALLTRLAVCAQCGRRMAVHYAGDDQ